MLAFIKKLNSFFSSLQRRSSLVLEDLSVNPKNPQLGIFEWILPWLDLLVLSYAGLDRINYWRHLWPIPFHEYLWPIPHDQVQKERHDCLHGKEDGEKSKSSRQLYQANELVSNILLTFEIFRGGKGQKRRAIAKLARRFLGQQGR